MTHIVVFSSFLTLVCGYALWRGGAPERWTAVMFALAALTSFMVPFQAGRSFHSVERGFVAIDAVLFCALLTITLAANRFWPIWITSVQLMTIAVHGVKAYDPTLVSWIYNGASSKLAYPMILTLAIGVARHCERVTIHGTDPDWSSWHRKAVDA